MRTGEPSYVGITNEIYIGSDRSCLTTYLYRCICADMDAIRLFLLGRRLTKLAEGAMRGSSEGVPPSVALIIQDVVGHDRTPITDIVARTGLPQSYVSSSIADLARQRLIRTVADPSDGRRTLARVAPGFTRRLSERGAIPVDDAIAASAGTTEPRRVAEITATLERLATQLSIGPSQPPPPRRGSARPKRTVS
jgi:DNA-binding MarR family transcriptional regulator